jgi:hypothetical protein
MQPSRSPYVRPGLVVAGILIVVGLIASSFRGGPRVELPEGEQEVTGTLVAVPLSATRRGTHVLEINDEPFVFVESDENLKSFEGIKVTVRGTFEENIDDSLLPVLVAVSVRPKALALTQWKHDYLGLSLNAPDVWNGAETSEGLRFTPAASSRSILVVTTLDVNDLPAGEPIVVGGEKGTKVDSGSGVTVYVQHRDRIIAFAFAPTSDAEAAEQTYEFEKVVLRSVSFASNKPVVTGSGSSTVTTGTGGGLGQPCGGAAGILCPAGQYCEITDAVNDIGRCRSVR